MSPNVRYTFDKKITKSHFDITSEGALSQNKMHKLIQLRVFLENELEFISTQLPRRTMGHSGGLSNVIDYACLGSPAYDLKIRLRPGGLSSVQEPYEISQ